jgi:hypothetical protein
VKLSPEPYKNHLAAGETTRIFQAEEVASYRSDFIVGCLQNGMHTAYLRTCPRRDHYYLCVENEQWQAHLTPSENTLAFSSEVQASLARILRGRGEIQVKVVEQ